MKEAINNIRVGQVLQCDDSPDVELDRICWIDTERSEVGLISITDKDALPHIASLAEIYDGLDSEALSLTSSAPTIIPVEASSVECKLSLKPAMDMAARFVPFFNEHQRLLFDRKSRWRTIKRAAPLLEVSDRTVMKYLRRYYQEGMTHLAFLPRHKSKGKRGPRTSTTKLGRPVAEHNRNTLTDGMPLTEKDIESLQKGYKRFYVDFDRSLVEAYLLTLHHYFAHKITKNEDGSVNREINPKLPLPSLRQFRYHAEKLVPRANVLLRRHSAREIELNIKPVLNSVRNLQGPGAQYQVDATGGLVELVDERNRSCRIGKAIIYAVIDSYSQLVVGWYVGLENASYSSLIHALDSAFSDKTMQLEMYESKLREWLKLEPDQPLMPEGVVCDELLTDSGPEMICNETDRLTELGLFRMGTAKPCAANWKAYVERFFGELKRKLRKVPGAANSIRKRAIQQPESFAVLTLSELKTYVAHSIIHFNYSQTVKEHPDLLELKDAGYQTATPIDFWYFGCAHRSGLGRQYPRDYLRAVMLPRATASVSAYGLKVNKLYYSNETLYNQLAFHRKVNRKNRSLNVVYDRRDVSVVWLENDNGGLGEPCYLTSRYSRFAGKNLWEVEQILKTEQNFSGISTRVAVTRTIPIIEYQDMLVNESIKARQANKDRTEFDSQARSETQNSARADESWGAQRTELDPSFEAESAMADEGSEFLDDYFAEAFQ